MTFTPYIFRTPEGKEFIFHVSEHNMFDRNGFLIIDNDVKYANQHIDFQYLAHDLEYRGIIKKDKTSSAQLYENYLLDCMSFEGYDDMKENPRDRRTKLKQFYDVFMMEYGWHYERHGQLTESIKEWLQGLPTCIGLDFYNHDILKRAELFCALNASATEKKQDQFLNRYWKYCAMRLVNMMKREKVI